MEGRIQAFQVLNSHLEWSQISDRHPEDIDNAWPTCIRVVLIRFRECGYKGETEHSLELFCSFEHHA